VFGDIINPTKEHSFAKRLFLIKGLIHTGV